MLLRITIVVLSFILPVQCMSVQETLTLRRKMKRLMERELNKGTLSPYEQYVYFTALEKLDDYGFMHRKNFTDKRLFTTRNPPSAIPSPTRQFSTLCRGLRECPIIHKMTRDDAVTSRARQCAKFNGTSFNGYFFNWAPYLRVADSKECELNCLAKGHRFFLRLSPKVEDGTPCLTDPKKMCIDGKCQEPPHGCENGKCFLVPAKKPMQKIFGLFTSKQSSGKLVLGYNAVITVPKGSTKINITEMQQSKNYLAIKAHNKDKYYLNGNWVIDLPRGYKIAGTRFYYKRPKRSQKFNEAIISDGPTKEALDIMIIYQGDEPNIMYSYYLPQGYPRDGSRRPLPAQPNRFGQTAGLERRPYPGEAPRPGPPRQPEVEWKLAEFTRCTKSCAGGDQTSVYHCVRTATNTRERESLCRHLSRPPPRRRVCNLQPCPPRWLPDDWRECSKTCGEGIQMRNLRCKQLVDENGKQTEKMLPINSCPQWSRPQVTKPCNIAECPEPSTWKAGEWEKCSVTCGYGMQQRKVNCISIKTNETVSSRLCQNSKLKKPATAQRCHQGSCETYWFTSTTWNKCPVECGGGKQHRLVFCGRGGGGSSLPPRHCKATKPTESRSCNRQRCQATWMTSQWSECSVACGKGIQHRSVFCAGKVGGKYQEFPVDACPRKTKPKTSRSCGSENCLPQWYTSEWKQCSKTCGGGSRSRQIICLNHKGERVGGCESNSRPHNWERCNTSPCFGSKKSKSPPRNCKDKSPSLCMIVVRANFCRYRTYKAMCCESCSKTNTS